MARLKHTWKETGKYESVCTRCGCERTKNGHKVGYQWISYYSYSRSGMNFGYNPECIDWNDNTLF